MKCREAARMLSQAQERKLSMKDRTLLEIHVMICSGCRGFSRQMDVLRKLARTYAKGPTRPER